MSMIIKANEDVMYSVNPIYYVMFTASTIFASFLLFRGFNTKGAPAVSLLGGFIVIFVGVYLLNLNRLIDPVTQQPRVSLVTGEGLAGTGRLSEHHERLLNGGGYHANHSRYSVAGRGGEHEYNTGRRSHSRHGSNGSILFNSYDHEESLGLNRMDEMAEEQHDDDLDGYNDEVHNSSARNKKKKRASLLASNNTQTPTQKNHNNSRNRNEDQDALLSITHHDAAHQLLDNDSPDSQGSHRR